MLICVKKPILVILFLAKSRSFAKQTYMKKISLIATLLLAVLLLQKCTKDTVTATATSSTTLFATINDTLWNADTIKASITYSSATKNKVFTCTGIANNKEINMSCTQTNAINTAGFPLIAFNADAAGNNTFSFFMAQKNTSGNYVFVQQGTVAAGSGNITVTAIDSVKKLITGIYAFTSIQNNLDNNGNIISVTVSQVSAGAFNSMPYTFTSN